MTTCFARTDRNRAIELPTGNCSTGTMTSESAIYSSSSQGGETSTGMAGARISRMPIEIWERIIDLMAENVNRHWSLRRSPQWKTLISCALTCKALYNRARWHLRGNIILRNRADVTSFSRLLRTTPYLRQTMRFITISGGSGALPLPVPHLGTFAIMLARYLPKIQTLVISNAKWGVGSVRQKDIVHLAAFHAIEELTLDYVCFATVSQFSQLISALPNLQ
ncbi:uncharacterized protein B0H18DRAFT_1018290 [Fomitopsis serialis]|uniref:uncharacterized protein n=1 Tax=Fomitopsis serialis TaxID=139415 RepID=UPI0020083A13|nr:uncharacterized protein B0H18DRAFT_1018290 [Neoantrodia serialis]KAH9922422.1 hypothetical protein B0H18DRAFT_1018290 [Neoantrodia serialis]